MNSLYLVALALSAIALGLIIYEGSRRRRRFWSRRFLLQRNSLGMYNRVLTQLSIEDPRGFKNFIRMTAGQFEELLCLVAPHIKKKDTNWRLAVSPAEQLIVTLRFMATGDSYTSLMYSHHISLSKISETIPLVCSVLIDVLKEYVKEPSTEKEWQNIANSFHSVWGFPHCLAAMDGRHIEIIQPAGTGSLYHNYTGTFSIVLLALVNAHYNCISYQVGVQGSISDGGVFNYSRIGKKFQRGNLALPKAKPLPGGTRDMPYVIVADDAFALSNYLMKPYPGWHVRGSKERIFNYRTSRARRISENFFGILTAVFRVLRTTMNLSPDRATLVTAAAVHLHNFLRRNKSSAMVYSPPGSFDHEDTQSGRIFAGSWRDSSTQNKGLQRKGRNAPQDAKAIREEFANYFISDIGKYPWQEKYA